MIVTFFEVLTEREGFWWSDWDRGGFVLYYKRLETGRFRWPEIGAGAHEVEMDATALLMLLDGIDVREVKRPKAWQPAGEKLDKEHGACSR